MHNDENTPSVRELRHGARIELMQAIAFLSGQPGMSHDEQIHLLSHAKGCVISALLALETASHTVLLRGMGEHDEDKIVAESMQGIADIEAMLATETDTDTTTEGD